MTSYLDDMSSDLAPPSGIEGYKNLGKNISNFFSTSGPSHAELLAQNLPQEGDINSVLGPQQTPAEPMAEANAAEAKAITDGQASADNLTNELRQQRDQGLKRVDSLRNEQDAAGQATIDAATAKTAMLTPLLTDIQDKFKDLDARTNQAYANTQAATQAQMTKWDAARTDAANAQIQDFFADKTTGGFVVGIISQALGGFANGLAGNPGSPTALDRVIQRDFEKQIQNMNQKNRVAAGEEGKLHVLMQSGLDQLQASAALRAALNDKLKLITDDVANRMGTQDAIARAAQIKADFDTKNEQIYQGVQSNYQQGRIQLEGKKLMLDMARAKFIGTVAKGAMLADPLANDVEGYPGDKTGKSNLAASISAYKSLDALAKDENNTWNPIDNHKTRTEMTNLVARIMGAGKQGRSFTIKQAENMVGGFFTDTKGSRKDLLQKMRVELQSQMSGGRAKGELANIFDMQDNGQ